MRQLLISFLLFTFILAMGCSKDEKNNPVAPQKSAPTIIQPTNLQSPVSQNAPPEISTQINMINQSMTEMGTGFFGLAAMTDPTRVGDTFSWVFNMEQLTITVVADYIDDNTVEWTATLNGTDGDTVYTNWVAMRGTSTADASSGSLEIYEINTTNVSFKYSWSTDDAGNITVTLELFEDNEKLVCVNNVDGSGSLTHYENDVKVFEAFWNADGSGSWSEYDSAGNIIDSGTWT